MRGSSQSAGMLLGCLCTFPRRRFTSRVRLRRWASRWGGGPVYLDLSAGLGFGSCHDCSASQGRFLWSPRRPGNEERPGRERWICSRLGWAIWAPRMVPRPSRLDSRSESFADLRALPPAPSGFPPMWIGGSRDRGICGALDLPSIRPYGAGHHLLSRSFFKRGNVNCVFTTLVQHVVILTARSRSLLE
jgi:hypothetical protein